MFFSKSRTQLDSKVGKKSRFAVAAPLALSFVTLIQGRQNPNENALLIVTRIALDALEWAQAHY